MLLQVPRGRNPSDKLDLRGEIWLERSTMPPTYEDDDCVLVADAQTMLLKLSRFPFGCIYEKVGSFRPQIRPPRNEVKATFCIYPSDVVSKCPPRPAPACFLHEG